MRLLVAVDFSPQTAKVLGVAKDLARATGARVTVLHVSSTRPGEDADASEQARLAGEAAEALRESGTDAEAIVREGQPARAIVEEADRIGADLVIVGSHGLGAVFRMILGSVSSTVLKKCRRPVMIVPANRAAG